MGPSCPSLLLLLLLLLLIALLLALLVLLLVLLLVCFVHRTRSWDANYVLVDRDQDGEPAKISNFGLK